MKLRNFAGAVLALAFTACGVRAFAAGGDITEIWPVGETDLVPAVTPVSTATYPLKAGDTVRFAIRLGKRNPTDRPWRLAHISAIHTEEYDAIFNPMKIGIYVSGVPHYATFDGELPYDNYTDFYFTYTVQHGDFALPVVLAVGTSSPKPAVGDKLRETEYYFDPKGAAAWQFNNSAPDNPGSGERATMSFKQSVDIENPDYDLRGAGFYVKTIDFEGIGDVAAGKPWRSVEAGTTKCDQTPRLAVDNYTALTNPVTLYVWSLDESVVRLTGAGVKPMQIRYPDSSTKVERQVLTAKLNAGDSDFPFKLEAGDDAEGKTTQLVLCAFPDFTYGEATEVAYEDYTTATVAVTPKSDPYMTLTKVGDEEAKRIDLKATSDYYASTALQLQFSQPYTNGDVKVSLRQFFGETEATAEDDVVAGKYLSFHLDPDADPTSDPSLEFVTVPKGSTEPVRFYVFALGSSVKTRKSPYLTLKPDLYADQPEAVTNFFAAGRSHQRNLAVKLDDQAPVIVQPKADTAYTAGAGSAFTVGLQISDNWRDLQESWATNGYSVTVEGMGVTKFTTNAVHFADGDLLTIEPTASEEGGEAVIRVTDPEGHQAETITISVNVIPRPRAEVLFYTDSTRQTRYSGNFYEHDPAKPYYLDISFNKGTAPANMYAFLVPQDANASNLVACAAVSNGLYIVQGYTNSENAVAVSFLDGFAAQNPMSARFKVLFKSTPTIDDPAAVDYTDGCGNPTVTMLVQNDPTTVPTVKLGTDSIKTGGTFYNVPAFIPKAYRAKISDFSPVDLKFGEGYENQEVWVRFEYTDSYEGWEKASTKNLYTKNSTNNYATCNIAFSYKDTVQRVNVYALDKDSRAAGVEMDELEWGDPLFSFYVNVAAPQSIVIHDKSQKAVTDADELVYAEDQTQVLSGTSGDFYISLSAQPGETEDPDKPISEKNPIRVKVTLEQYGDGVLNIQTNYVYFTSPGDMAMKPIRIDTATLNGGMESVWWMTAEVDMEDPDSKDSDGHSWKEHFAAASCMVRVSNADPVISKAVAKGVRTWTTTGTNNVTVGEAVTVTWEITDITNDFYEAEWKEGRFQIEWSNVAAAEEDNPLIITNDWPRKKGIGTKGKIYGESHFKVPDQTGAFEITMAVNDGDMTEPVTYSWWVYVAPSKRAKVAVFGPKATVESKYKAAKGAGQGFVAAKGTLALCEQFAQTWQYEEATADAELFAFGYPATNTWARFVIENPGTGASVDDTTDSGKLPGYIGYTTLNGVPLNRLGNYVTKPDATTVYYDWATHGGVDPDAGRYDSYFYRWMVTKAASGDKEASGDTPSTPSPTFWPFDGSSKTFTLDAGNGGGKTGTGVTTYGTVGIEAIFSRELRERDNLGDINADGIPDKIVELYGLGAEEVGAFPENDLDSLSAFNDDEDYLPNTAGAAIYSSLIPGLPDSWGEGLEFTAKTEVRGFHDGLNDGAKLAGLSQYRFDADYDTVRDYSDIEQMAWEEHGKAKNWSPERPTDPTKADTDEDKFPDGYEYYFWYKAHVGYLENGVHRYLTGRAYDPRNPGEGKFISAATIARIMDPRSDLEPVDFPENYIEDPSDAKTRDTDKDGLPDLLEFEIGTNPFDFDTDGDGLPDGFEIMIAGTNPLKAYTTGSIADGMRNFDGDAMAFTTPELEEQVKPKPLHIEVPFTFALVEPDGDTDGVQWYVSKTAQTNVVIGQGCVTGTVVTAAGKTFVTSAKTVPVVDGRLAADLPKESTWEAVSVGSLTNTYACLTNLTETGYVALMPTRIAAGSLVKTNAAAYATLELGEEIEDLNAAWVYGSKTIPTQTTGDNLANQGGYGMLAVGRYRNAPAKRQLAALPKADKTVAYLHYLVYQEFGFDPRTAWNANTPLAARWGTTVGSGENQEVKGNVFAGNFGYAGIATRTREFTTYDEFLLFSFFLNNGMDVLTYEDLGDRAPSMAELWYANTTNPQGPTEEVNSTGAETEGDAPESEYWGRNDTNGADTDGDGVPDGWELYVMAGPKNPDTGKYVFAMPYLDGYRSSFGPFEPDAASATLTDNSATSGYDSAAGDNDGLTELQEFAGTDSCAWYAVPQGARKEAFSTTIARPEEHKKWLNKFFPTDPWNEDTDGDGLTDGNEYKNANGFNAGNFLYGDAIDTGKTAIPGGGLNPCAMDTDLDGLPDPWEAQFAGKTIYTGENAQYVKGTAADGSEATSSSVTLQGLCDGMDGTVFDAYNSVYVNRSTGTADRTDTKSEILILNGVNQVVDRDYDKDGLENWQEYLVGAMRCWRYDDPFSGFGYIASDLYFDALGSFAPNYKALGIETEGRSRKEISDEFWYKTLFDKTSEIYNPHLVTDQSSGAQYFTRVRYGFDPAFTEAGTYYILYDRVGWNRDGTPTMLGDLWGVQGYGLISAPAPKKYISCDPTKSDTDQDGMDDYYELFHGMNPLLGADYTQITSKGGCDIVYDAWYDENFGTYQYPNGDQVNGAPCRSLANLWIAKGGQRTGFAENRMDFVKFPWLNGLETADPDGDDIRNQAESIMAKVAPTSVFLHTDPTPLWMTDSSYTNSLVYRFFRLPTNFSMVSVPETITVGDKTIPLYTCDGYTEGIFGPFLAQFLPDYWSVTAEETQNWIASFEENEGYDTDHDVLGDYEEFKGNLRGASDPQDFDSPHRRQAMYFPGKDAALQSMPFVAENHPRYTFGYPDDMSFLQYTVECWVRPESAADATVIERGIWTSWSNPGDQELLRKNFQVAVKNGKWYTKFDSGTLTGGSVEVQGETDVEVGKWTHVAATYDAEKLILYVNGVEAGKKGFEGKGLMPEYGSSAVVVHPGEGTFNTNGFWGGRANGYWFDKEYSLHAFLIGASFKGIQDLGGVHSSHLNVVNGAGWSRYKDFFKGYIDEVRIWDGARSSLDIKADMKVRYTAALAKANRDDFYEQWVAGMRRYDKDGGAKDYEVIPELRYHWSFDSVPGAANAEMAAKVPLGYAAGGVKAPLSRPDDWTIGWWSDVLKGYGSVYSDPTWVTWVPNTVTHLPRFDGTTLDSFYWSDDFMGDTAEKSSFAHTAEPVSRWTQYVRNGLSGATTSDGIGMDFESTGRRFWLANVRGTNEVTNLAILFEFTGRHLNQQGDDLLPLGGAFAKYCDDMWDEQGPSMPWEVTGDDGNGNGLPDWWEEYAKENYLLDPADADNMKWTTPVDYNGRTMTAGQAYLYDLNRGLYADKDGNVKTGDATFAQKADEDKDGMPDWWEEANGLHNGATDLTAGGHADGDPDNDGLANYQEYLIAHGDAPYGFYTNMTPNAARSLFEGQSVVDYFLPVPQSSLATIRKLMMARSSVPNAKVPNELVSKGEYLGAVFTDHDFMEDYAERALLKGQSSPNVYDPYDDVDADGWDNWSEIRAYVSAGTIVKKVGEKEKLITQVLRGTSDEIQTQVTGLYNKYGEVNVACVDWRDEGWDWARNTWKCVVTYRIRVVEDINEIVPAYKGTPVPTVNVRVVYRGAKIRNVLAGYAANAPATDSDGLVGAAFKGSEDNPINIHLSFHTTSLEIPDALYVQTPSRKEVLDGQMAFTLKETSRIKEDTKTVGEYGFVRQGHNKLIVFADTSDDGTWQPGEPYGIVRDVQIGWDKVAEVVVELTDESAVVKRMPLVAAQEGAERGGEQKEEDASALGQALVRVVRESINGQTVADSGELIRERVLLQKMLPLAAGLTEIDVLTAKKPDLDWLTLTKDAAKYGIDNVKSVKYRVETVTEDGTNVVGTFRKEFTEERPQAVAVSPVQDAPVYSSAPTFRFDVDEGATAFGIQVAKEDGTILYDSGARTLCGLGTDGVGNRSYAFMAPIYAGEPVKSMNGTLLESGKRYMWRVVAFNAKFDAAAGADYSSWMNFQIDVDNVKRYPGLETGYGRVDVAVRYYGPQRLAAGFDQKSIVVEAFDNAGFTGVALAQTRVEAGKVDLDSLTDVVTANARLKGVEPGDVYVRAYIDLNDDGTWQKHEPWGYANKTGSVEPDLFTAVPAKVDPSMAGLLNPVRMTVFIEDTDVNKNEYPDCLEQASFPDADDEDDEEDAYDWWTWANADEDDPAFAADGDVMAYAEVDRYLVAIGPESETDRTKWGYYLLSADETKVPDLSDRGNLAAGNYKLDTCYVYGNGRIWSAPLYGLGIPVTISDPTLLVKDVKPVKVALVHNQVYQAFPYNMRTANPEAFEPDANGIDVANRSKTFTAIDRKLLPRYFEAIGYAPSLDPDKTLDLYIDELFKQGKVKDATDLCNAYSLKVGDLDQNRDGIADGWQLYVMFGPNGELAASTPWTSAAAARTATSDGDITWVQEYDGGRYPTNPWNAHTLGDYFYINGVRYDISDKDAYAYHLKHFAGEEGDKYADFDNDGLCNYDEFDIMKNNNRTLDADNMFSYFGSVTVPALAGQCVPDYFLKSQRSNPKASALAGELVYDYLGFDYTGADFIEGWWKNQYGLKRNEFVADFDTDGDGWDAYCEARVNTNPDKVTESAIDGYVSLEFPIPTVELTLTLPEVSGSNAAIIVEANRSSAGTDARWIIGGTEAGAGEKFLGFNPGLERHYNFGGSIVPGTFKLEFKDQTGDYEKYLVNTNDSRRTLLTKLKVNESNNVWADAIIDTKVDNESSKGYLVDRRDGNTVYGEIDYDTGDVTVLFDRVNADYGEDGAWRTWFENDTECVVTYYWKSYVRASWETKASAVSHATIQRMILADAAEGHLRQGYNTFTAFVDSNGNGAYDPGEPFGCVKDVKVGWDKVTDLNIALTTTTPVLPRFDPAALGAVSNETGDVTTEIAEGAPVITDVTPDSKVRIVRWTINGEDCIHRIVLSKTAGDLGVITEADVLSKVNYDLDWGFLLRDAAQLNIEAEDITEAVYAVFVGDTAIEEENVNGWIVKKFAVNRAKAAPVSPSESRDAIVKVTRPEFAFTVPDGYPAYVFELSDADGNAVFTSTNLVGRRNAAGNETYRPPVFFGWDEAEGVHNLLPNGTYTWRIAMLNAKFRTAGDWSEAAKFTVELAKGKVHDTDKGILEVAVRYYGDAPIDADHPIVVQAFKTADFTGVPEGQAIVTNAAFISSYDDTNTVNAVIYGLPEGDYYVLAFGDITNDCRYSSWETWGYANKVGTGARDIYTPVAAQVGPNVTAKALVFVEDMDGNNNEIPDWMEGFPADDGRAGPNDGFDTDGDGMSDDEEEAYGTDPDDADSDDDGVPDGAEIWGGTDPLTPDADFALPGDMMAFEDVKGALLVRIGTSKENSAWYAVMDLANEGWKLRDSDIPLQTPATDIQSLVTTWKMGAYTGIGTNVTFTGDEKVLETRFSDIRLIHAQVYAKNGYETGCAAVCLNEGGDPRLVDGIAAAEHPHTKPFTALDKYLVCRYLEAIGVEGFNEKEMNAKGLWSKMMLKADEIDNDRDDIADGWELYTMFGVVDATGRRVYVDAASRRVEGLAISPWNTADGLELAPGEGSQLKLVEEFDGGYYPTDPWSNDTDRDSVIDYYAYQYHLKGNDAGKDFDLDEDGNWVGDGLSNYAEYLISEVFQYAKLDPENPKTDGDCVDYFRKIGDLYVGEIFTDHDQVDDVWEGEYADYANRYVYDPNRDNDGDGWSNYAEFRAGTDPSKVTTLGVSGADGTAYTKSEYPIPVIEAKVVYNGNNVNLGSIVFKAWNEAKDPGLTSAPDAIWTIGNGKAAGTEEPGSTAPSSETGSTAEPYEKYLGRRPSGVQRYALGGGSILRGSVNVRFLDQTYARTGIGTNVTKAAAANWYVGVTDREGALVDLRNGNAVGTVDYNTGVLTLDCSKFTGSAIGLPNPSGEAEATLVADPSAADGTGAAYYDTLSLDGSYLLLAWSAVNVGLSANGIYTLGDADGVNADAKSHGHVREGLTTFCCFADENGDGLYTMGEPFGVVRGVDVGWQGAEFTVELTDVNPVFARVDLYNGGGETDRSIAWNGACGDIRGETLTNFWKDAAWTDTANDFDYVRIVPYAVSGTKTTTAYYDRDRDCVQLADLIPNRVVAEFAVSKATKPFISEADFLRDGEFDIDWNGFRSAIVNNQAVYDAVGEVTAVKYRIVFGREGPVGYEINAPSPISPVRAYSTLVERRFDAKWAAPRCEGVIGGGDVTDAGVIHSAHPTFVWSMPKENESEFARAFGCSYTAFKIRVFEGKEEIYNSGVVRAPAQDDQGRFVWTAPISVGDQTPQGKIFRNSTEFSWTVVMYNAKFQPGGSEPFGSGLFSTSVNTQSPQNDAGFSSIGVTVKYTGPSAVLDGCESITSGIKNSAGASIAAVQGVVRVQAFTTADFSGIPAAETYVADKTALTDTTDVLTNACLKGLAAGTYYVRTYIDMNGNFVKDDFESWGYAKEPITVGQDVERMPVVGLYIEDADTNGNWYPDAWEYAYLSKWAKNWDEIRGSEAAKPLPDGQIVLSSAVYDQMVSGIAGISTGLSGTKITVFQDEKFAKLILKPYYDYKSKIETTFDAIRKAVEKKIVDKTLKITAITLDTSKSQVTLAMDAEVDYANLVAGNFATRLYDLDAMGIDATCTVTVQVWKKTTLAQENWELVGEFEKTFGRGETEVEVPVRDNGAEVDPTSGFYMIKVVQ